MDHTQSNEPRLLIVSNRLPFNVAANGENFRFVESSGGLVSGLSAYLASMEKSPSPPNKYVWIGWPGATVDTVVQSAVTKEAHARYNSHPVFLTQEEMDHFYFGFCNKTIWPLFHYFPSFTQYDEAMWEQYQHVNEVFAKSVLDVVNDDDIVWVHDYHLMLLPQLLKAQAPNLKVGFFLHIPFPSFEMFRLLPGEWRRKILEGLTGADLVGFHTYEYTQHFLQCVLRILGHEHHMGRILTPHKLVKAETFPMGIDYDKFSRAAVGTHVQHEVVSLRESLGKGTVILSVDRLDYTKGILNRLQAFEILLETSPELHQKVVLLMIVVPSRIGVEQYDLMKRQIEELVGKINGRFGTVGWTPVIYHYRHVPFENLVALYSISDVALVSPLRDGMNLVAKEYIATRTDGTGVLILSEMAGASKELGESLVINPNNRLEIAEAMRVAIEMPRAEQQRRNRIMQARLQRYTVSRWATDFVNELLAILEKQSQFGSKLLPGTTKLELAREYNLSNRRLLFFDYDGTLAPFKSDPELAGPSSEVYGILSELSGDVRNRIVIISGRDRATLQKWFGSLRINLVAEHGSWFRDEGQEWAMLKPQAADWKANLLPILQLYSDRLPGSFVEEKNFSLVWHYRAADPEQGQQVGQELTDQLVNFTANIDIQVLRGNKVIEVRAAGINKGTAGLRFLSQGTYDFIFSIGDDWTDEDLFAVLPPTAYSVKVGIANTRARYNLRDVHEVIGLLSIFAMSSRENAVHNAARVATS